MAKHSGAPAAERTVKQCTILLRTRELLYSW